MPPNPTCVHQAALLFPSLSPKCISTTKTNQTSRPQPVSLVCNTTRILMCYIKHGLLDKARDLFDDILDRDVVTWTAMISGYTSNGLHSKSWAVFRKMVREGVDPNAFTVSSALVACRGMRWRHGGQVVHGLAVKRGLVGNSYVDNTLVDVYATCGRGSMDDARMVFERIASKTEVAWTMMITGYTHSGDWNSAIQVFSRMLQEGVGLNPFSCSIAIRACTALQSLIFGRQLHAASVKAMSETSIPVSNSLLDMYCRCTSILEAKQYFNEMPHKDLITWNTMIGGLARCSPHEALQLLPDMENQDMRPNCITLCTIITACVELGGLNCGQQVHGTIVQRGFGGNLPIANALIDMYSKCGSMHDSRRVFDEIGQKDLVSWTSMMDGYGAHGHTKEAIKLFDEMVRLDIPLDHIAFLGVLSACSHGGLVDEGLKYFSHMVSDYGILPSQEIYGCLVDLLGRAGRIEEAYELIAAMPFEPEESVWCALLGACMMHKNVVLGKLAAKKILSLNQKGATTYVMLSNIFAASGEWDELARTRRLLKETGSRKEAGRSWIELKDAVCSFSVGDRCNPQVDLVYDVLDMLFKHMSDADYVPDLVLPRCLEGVT